MNPRTAGATKEKICHPREKAKFTTCQMREKGDRMIDIFVQLWLPIQSTAHASKNKDAMGYLGQIGCWSSQPPFQIWISDFRPPQKNCLIFSGDFHFPLRPHSEIWRESWPRFKGAANGVSEHVQSEASIARFTSVLSARSLSLLLIVFLTKTFKQWIVFVQFSAFHLMHIFVWRIKIWFKVWLSKLNCPELILRQGWFDFWGHEPSLDRYNVCWQIHSLTLSTCHNEQLSLELTSSHSKERHTVWCWDHGWLQLQTHGLWNFRHWHLAFLQACVTGSWSVCLCLQLHFRIQEPSAAI